LGTFEGHPKYAANPALFMLQTAPIAEGLITINVDKKVEGWLLEYWEISSRSHGLGLSFWSACLVPKPSDSPGIKQSSH